MALHHVKSIIDLVASGNKKGFIDTLRDASKVGVIGYPGAGKTTFAGTIKNKKIIHTDDYLQYSHDERPEHIIKDLKEPFIVEGNEVTRLVKRGVEFDLIVLITGSERTDKSINGLKGRVDKFLKEYEGPIYVINPRKS